jgi:hypothetical protein
MLFKERMTVYSVSYTKPLNTKHRATDCYDSMELQLPLGFKELNLWLVSYITFTL